MKRLITVLVPVLIVAGGAYATGGKPAPPKNPANTIVDVDNDGYQEIIISSWGGIRFYNYNGSLKKVIDLEVSLQPRIEAVFLIWIMMVIWKSLRHFRIPQLLEIRSLF